MNGRVYDYRLGRFLSVDPIISNPANSQSRRWKKVPGRGAGRGRLLILGT